MTYSSDKPNSENRLYQQIPWYCATQVSLNFSNRQIATTGTNPVYVNQISVMWPFCCASGCCLEWQCHVMNCLHEYKTRCWLDNMSSFHAVPSEMTNFFHYGTVYDSGTYLNYLCAEFISGNINVYLRFHHFFTMSRPSKTYPMQYAPSEAGDCSHPPPISHRAMTDKG